VDDVDELCRFWAEKVGVQLRDGVHKGSIDKPGSSGVKTCDPGNLLSGNFVNSSPNLAHQVGTKAVAREMQ